jgi:histidyl-tRNA synthetase
LAKVGPEAVAAELAAAGATAQQTESVLQLAKLDGSNAEILKQVAPLVAGSEKGERGLAQLSELVEAVTAVGMPDARLKLDVAIARGLDYYTGMVVETFLDELPGIGSVASGGRYDNLAETFTSQQLPGVGASLGLDRLLAAMEELGRIEPTQTTAEIFLPQFDAAHRNDYLRIAASLRLAGFGVELYPEAKKLGKQLQYADRRGFRIALVIGPDEFTAGKCQVKHLATGSTTEVPLTPDAAALITELHRLLAQN